MKEELINATTDCENAVTKALRKFYDTTGFEPETIDIEAFVLEPRRRWVITNLKLTFSYPHEGE